jgi:hypothetical protein
MKHLLAALPLLTGCISDGLDDGFDLGKGDGDPNATLAARWSVEQLATGAVLGCPEGFGTAAVFSQRIDSSGQPDGKPLRELFDCAAGRGSTTIQRGTYDVWVELRSDLDAVFARSAPRRIVLAQDELAIDAKIYEDAGFFGLRWQLRDGATKAIVSCANAPRVTAIEVVVDNDLANVDRFACDEGIGHSRPLLPGTHTISVRAVDEAGAVVAATAPVEGLVTKLSAVTDLGTLTIPLPR